MQMRGFKLLDDKLMQGSDAPKAKARPRGNGRPPRRPATAMAKADDVMRLKAAGVRPIDIGRRLGISRKSVYRIFDARQGPAKGQ